MNALIGYEWARQTCDPAHVPDDVNLHLVKSKTADVLCGFERELGAWWAYGPTLGVSRYDLCERCAEGCRYEETKFSHLRRHRLKIACVLEDLATVLRRMFVI